MESNTKAGEEDVFEFGLVRRLRMRQTENRRGVAVSGMKRAR